MILESYFPHSISNLAKQFDGVNLFCSVNSNAKKDSFAMVYSSNIVVSKK